MADPQRVEVGVTIAGVDISEDVVYEATNFTTVAAAQPGMCSITVRDFEALHSFTEGSIIEATIDGARVWRGYLFTLERAYEFPAAGPRRFVISGIDLNILLDKLVMYNRAHPTKYPDGGGTYKRRKVVDDDGTTAGWIVAVPKNTYDREYIKAMLADFDLDRISPTIRYSGSDSRIDQIAAINPDGKFTPPGAGTTLRDFFVDVARNVNKTTPGSVIFYIDPDGYIVWQEQDSNLAPFWVGDADPDEIVDQVTGENVRDLRITSDISRIKNDVLIFAGETNPSPSSRQVYLKYRHAIDTASVAAYGRFQYSEVLQGRFLQVAVDARANKILNQEGEPAGRVEFTTFRPGLAPGQIVWIVSEAHGYGIEDDPPGGPQNYPIRSITLTFPQPDIVSYRVSCSFDTQDPWGLLLALKRPPTRGLTQPRFKVVDLRRNTDQDLSGTQMYSLVKEYPRHQTGGYYRCSYAYIRDSMTVYVGRLRRVALEEPTAGTVGYWQTNPERGRFQLSERDQPSGNEKVYVEYHLAHDIPDDE